MDWLTPVMRSAAEFAQGHAGPDTHDRATARAGAPLVPGATTPMGIAGQQLGDTGRGLAQEGATAALLDPVGFMDRQRAQRELSDRFQVIPADFHGRRRANMVTEAEFERIAHTFSDIRLGRGDLTLDTSMMSDPAQAAQYRDGTMANIADMMMTTGGRDLIERMHDNVMHDDAGQARHGLAGVPLQLPMGAERMLPEVHRHTTIRPFFLDANGDDNLTNDPTTAADYDNSNAMADARGASGDTASGAIDASGRDQWGRVGGRGGVRGQGTDSTLWWNPTVNDGSRSDVILAHELNHAYNETQGTMAAGQYGLRSSRDFGLDNFERQATGLANDGDNRHDDRILTENQYIRERNALGLGDHLRQRPAYRAPLR